MSDEQLKILNEIADRYRKTQRSEEEAKASLIAAGIITDKGNVRKPYREVFKRK